MPLTIPTATQRIAKGIQRTEKLTDDTLISAAELFADIVRAGGEFREHEAARFAQPALLRAHKAIGDLTDARGELSRTHAALLDARRITMAPEERECPDWVIGPTTAVESAAA